MKKSVSRTTLVLGVMAGLAIGVAFNKWMFSLGSVSQFVVNELIFAYVIVGIMLWHRVSLIGAIQILSEHVSLLWRFSFRDGIALGLAYRFLFVLGLPGLGGICLPFVLLDRGLKRLAPTWQNRLHQTRLITFIDDDWKEFRQFQDARFSKLLRDA